MKTTILTVFVLTFFVKCYSQEQLQISPETGLITYEKVIEAPGKSADELFAIAKSWVVANITSPEDLTESKPTILSVTYVRNVGGWGMGLVYPFRHSLVIKVRDGAVKVIVDRIARADSKLTAESYWKKNDGTIREKGTQQKPLNDIAESCNQLGKTLEAKIAKGDTW